MNCSARILIASTLVSLLLGLAGCGAEEEKPRPNGQLCESPGQCESNLCHSATCLDPAADDDGDGLINEVEFALGTDAKSSDSDGDGIPDFTEVVSPSAPADQDGDGMIDAVESAHVDGDCNQLSDQYDNPDVVEPGEVEDSFEATCPESLVAKSPELAGKCCPDMDGDKVADIEDCDPSDASVAIPAHCEEGDYAETTCNTYTCQKGFQCVAQSKCPTSDEPCSTVTCDEETGCAVVPAEKNCDDDDPCTEDICVNGETCLHAPRVCNDGVACTEDYCDPASGSCVFDPMEGAGCIVECGEETCEPDDNPCTAETCGEGGCDQKPRPDGGPCEDPKACIPQGVCVGGACEGASACEDGQLCVDGACVACETEAECAEGLMCVDGACVECGSADDCVAIGLCQEAACESGVCVAKPVEDGLPCDDSDACTEQDACASGACEGQTKSCDDDNECTEDLCDAESGCSSQPIDGDCEDGDACTLTGSCVDGGCVPGDAVTCDDSNPCTEELCDPESGCSEPSPVADDSPCDDGDACTAVDVCVEGACLGVEATSCDDENPCTADTCDPELGCIQLAIDGPCDDGDACTAVDVCVDGACAGSGVIDCDDGNPCTIEGACEAEAGGCVYAVDDQLCGFSEVCGQLDGCNGDCAAVSTFSAPEQLYLDNAFAPQDGGSWLCEASPDCTVQPDDLPTSQGAFVMDLSAEFPEDGPLRIKIFNEDPQTGTSVPVYTFLMTMEDGVATAVVQALSSFDEALQYTFHEIGSDEGQEPLLPSPGEWFSFSIGVGVDGALDIALPNGDSWSHWGVVAGSGAAPPYTFKLKVGNDVEVSTLLVVPNVDNCCAINDDCEDGDPCTEHVCSGGACAVQSDGCEDGDPCTKDICGELGCAFEAIGEGSSVEDQIQGIGDGCASLGCTPVVASTVDDVTVYCSAVCDSIVDCELNSTDLVVGDGTVEEGETCVESCQSDVSANLLSAVHWSCRSHLAQSQELCGPDFEEDILAQCGDVACPAAAELTCQEICGELEGCGFSGLAEAPVGLDAIWGPGPLCAASCQGFEVGGFDTQQVGSCISAVFDHSDCDFEMAATCGTGSACVEACTGLFGDGAEGSGCHAGTPIRGQFADLEACQTACQGLPHSERARFLGCATVSGCGVMKSECTDPQATFGEIGEICQSQCSLAVATCGPLPFLSSVDDCASWCEGAAVSSNGLDETIDLSGALVEKGCPMGVEQIRVLFTELLAGVPVCEEACGTAAAAACLAPDEGQDYDEQACQDACASDYFEQPTGYIEDGSCAELVNECLGDGCECLENCVQSSPSAALCQSACELQVEQGLYASADTCHSECVAGGDDALVHAACWVTSPTAFLAATRCEQDYAPGELSTACIEMCAPQQGEATDLCSDWAGYSCALVCEGASRWALDGASDGLMQCMAGMLGTSCDVASIGPQCGSFACTETQCPLAQEACKVNQCDLELGACVLVDEVDQVSCDPEDLCVQDATCLDGVCTGSPVDCEDPAQQNNPCVQSVCEPTIGCGVENLSATTPCDDGNACTDEDSCDGAGGCAGQTVSCDDNIECTEDGCDTAVGCSHTPNDELCGDQVPCTADFCGAEGCVHQPKHDQCQDGSDCTSALCNKVEGCVYTPLDSQCDDQDSCTNDLCSISDGCIHEAIPNCDGGSVGEQVCPSGAAPGTVETLPLTNPSAESGTVDWSEDDTFTLLAYSEVNGPEPCPLPAPPVGDFAWILGDVCTVTLDGPTAYFAWTEVPLTIGSKGIIQSGHGLLTVTAQAGTDHSGVSIMAVIQAVDATGGVTQTNGAETLQGPTNVPWNPITAEASLQPTVESLRVGVRFAGEQIPVGGWFDDLYVEVLSCP